MMLSIAENNEAQLVTRVAPPGASPGPYPSLRSMQEKLRWTGLLQMKI